MIEDKLTHDERLRLECIAQAIAANAAQLARSASMEKILSDAAKIEDYVSGGRPAS